MANDHGDMIAWPLPVDPAPDFGDGSDGELVVVGAMEVQSGHNHPLQYTNVTVRRGGVLTVPAWDGNAGGVLRLHATGTVTIEEGGMIDVSGKGFRGGVDLTDPDDCFDNAPVEAHGESWTQRHGGGGGGGGIASNNYGSAGGGGGGNGTAGENAQPNTCCNGNRPGGVGGLESPGGPELAAGLVMGAGGGAGKLYANDENPRTCHGGSGGGAVHIVAANIVLHGEIRANGADGGRGTARYASGGGGGSGGTVLLQALELVVRGGTVTCRGGAGGAHGPDGGHQGICSQGGQGGAGRVRIDADKVDGDMALVPDSCTQHRQNAPASLCPGSYPPLFLVRLLLLAVRTSHPHTLHGLLLRPLSCAY